MTTSDLKNSKEKLDDRGKARPRRNFFKNKNFIYARKECFFTKNRISYIDFKDIELLKRFIKKSGQIIPSRVTGTTNINQKKLSKAVKRARFMGLLPFRGDIVNPFRAGDGPRRMNRGNEQMRPNESGRRDFSKREEVSKNDEGERKDPTTREEKAEKVEKVEE